MADMLVEILVLLITDLLTRALPQSRGRIESLGFLLFPIIARGNKRDRKCHMIRILVNHLANLEIIQKLTGILA